MISRIQLVASLKFYPIIFVLLNSNFLLAQQASNVSTSWTNNTTLQISWTAGAHNNSMVVVYPSDVALSNPSGLSYTANTAYGSGSSVGAGYVVYSGSGTSVTVTNIMYCSPACILYGGGYSNYSVKVFDNYYYPACFCEIYNTTDASSNPINSDGISPEPAQATNISSSSITANSMTLSWSAGSGTGRMTLIYSGSLVGGPADCNTYGPANTTYGTVAVSGVGYIVANGNVSSAAVTNLSPGTTYYFGTYEFYDVSGLCRNYATYNSGSNFGSAITICSLPTLATATGMTQTSFMANWNSSVGAASYQLDVSTDNTFASGMVVTNQSVAGLSSSVTGLAAATTYYYRVRAVNASGVSGNSAVGTVLTIPSTPVATSAATLSQTGFTANWNAVSGASNYFIDFASDAGFSTIVSGYNNLSVATNSVAVTSLSSGTTYYYRVRSADASGSSPSSNVISQITIPAIPVTAAATAIAQTSFQANWAASTGASGYFLDVSTSNTFGSIVTGYSNLSVGNVTSYVVNTNLSTSSTYYYRVRANNAAGTSGSSSSGSALTTPATPVSIGATLPNQTGFTANWNAVSGASNYFIDFASDAGFSTIVSGYNNLSVATNSVAVTSLSSGTTYYYRVRSADASGSSPSSNVISQITIPANPVIAAATAIAQTSFQLNWASSLSANNYFLDVSSNNFSTFVTGFNNFLVGNATSYNVIGLSANQTYYCQLRAVNSAGTSGNSNVIIALTIPPTPVAIAASSVFNAGFTANWNAILGLSNYFVDIALDAAFASMVGGYNNFSVTTNLLAVTGLNAGTNYYYRIRSQNATGSSPSSNTVSQITIPLAPTGLGSSSVGSSQFIISWNAVAGADSYSVDVSKTGDFSTLLSGYNGYPTTITNAVISGLSPSTAYYYRVRAVNTGGSSPATVGTPVGTKDPSGNSNSLSINVTSQPNLTIGTVNGTAKVSAQTTGGFGTVSVNLLYRGITDPSFTSTPITLSGGNYSFTVTSALADSLGLEYYFIATDEIGSYSTAHNFIYNTIDASSSSAIPFSDALNGSTSTYQLFSVPYMITDKNIATVFSALGAYDKTKWRLFHYQNGKYAEYQNGLTNIDLGSGYWFNATEKVSIKPGAGNVANNVTQSTPYTLTLSQGWNQIGNPFPFPISWSAVKAANPNATINSLFTFTSAGYTKTDGFKPWTGAFLWSDNGGNVLIPLSAKCKGCRFASSESISPPDLDEDSWLLPISLNLNGHEQVSGIGMNPQASSSKDKFDEITIPRFVEYLEMNTYHKEYFDPYFSTDIVPDNRVGTWEFTLSSNQNEGNAILSWDQAAIQNNSSKLALFDRDGAALIDMKATHQYALIWREGKKIKILYSKDGDILPEVTLLGQAYPNPFSSTVTIPVLLDQNQSLIQIYIYDMLGRKVKTIAMEQAKAGSLQLEWDGQNDQGNKIESGLYIYQLHGDKGILSTAKKVIKQ